jgi:hypothetical protein
MTPRRLVLISLLFASCGYTRGGETARGAEQSRSPAIDCTIRTSDVLWRPREEVTVSVEIRAQGAADVMGLPSLQLLALPRTPGPISEEYWAPFDMTGSSTHLGQKIQPADETHPMIVRLIPSRLLWAATRQSVWPSQPLAKAVPPGKYLLRVEIELEPGKRTSSNEIEITITE